MALKNPWEIETYFTFNRKKKPPLHKIKFINYKEPTIIYAKSEVVITISLL